MKQWRRESVADYPKIKLLNINISLLDYHRAVTNIGECISRKQKVYICVAATHLIVECQANRFLRTDVNKSFMVTPDGMPLVWLLKLKGYPEASRVYGPTLMGKICINAVKNHFSLYLLGGAPGQSGYLAGRLKQSYPGIAIAGYRDTPGRLISPEDNRKIIKDINRSNADIVFVGLGCPIQEEWMIANRNKLIPPVLVGVGAAFDILSGYRKQAPVWMQNNGLEWIFRLSQEPGRLWRRYLINNMLFIYFYVKEMIFKFHP